MDKNTVYNKVLACLICGAMGDALGYEVEFDFISGIKARFGERGITKPYVTGSEPAVFSDDTQMTFFTMEGLINYLTDPHTLSLTEQIYESYLNWLCTQGKGEGGRYASKSFLLKDKRLYNRRAPGTTCMSALSSGEMGLIANPLNYSKGCGGVMRISPLGFVSLDQTSAVAGAEAAAITHGHPLGYIPAAMLSDMVYHMIYGEDKKLEDIIWESLKTVKELYGQNPSFERFEDLITLAVRLAYSDKSDLSCIQILGEGWAGDEALSIAVFSALRHADDISEAMICAVNHSGDSDSTGAITGSILGAYNGMDQVPEGWMEKTEGMDICKDLAERLMEVI